MLLALPLCHSSNLSFQMPLQAYGNCAIGPLQVGFSFIVEPPTICIFICLVSVLMYAFMLSGAMLILTYGGSTIGVCTIATLWSLPHGSHMCNLVMVIGPHLGMHRVAAPSTALSRERLSA